MLYLVIMLSFAFVGTTIAWMVLMILWDGYDFVAAKALPILRAGNNMPGANNYMDLKFSLLRHAVMFFVTALIIYLGASPIVLNIFFYGHGFYAVTPITRYLHRKDILKDLSKSDESKALAQMLMKPFKDSRVVVIYSICAELLIIILYAIRP